MIWILAIVAVYVVLVLGVAFLSLRPYRTPIFVSPGSMGANQEEISFESDGITLHGWWVEADGAGTVAVLAHGYMMNRAELVPVAFWLWQRGISSLLFDFRAHGRSGGKKCGFGYLERCDVAAAVAYARSRAPGAKILLIGSSMGSAASALALGEGLAEANGLVLDSCYSKLAGAILGWWRFLGGKVLQVALWPTVYLAAPLAGFNPFKVDVAESLAKNESTPTLFIHGTRDTLALPTEAQRNFAACRAEKQLVWLQGYGHSEGRWEEPATYYGALEEFLARHALLREPAGKV